MYFAVYAANGPPAAKVALEVLVSLGSLRRSLFSSDEERQVRSCLTSPPPPPPSAHLLASSTSSSALTLSPPLPSPRPSPHQAFLLRMLNGTLSILQTQRGLSDHGNYHELCRLLARLKSNFQLSELVTCAPYEDWIRIVATFTVDSFKHWEWAANSVYYLLSLWSRLVASMPYLKGETPSHLEGYVPEVITAFITSRMQLVTHLIAAEEGDGESSEVDNPLDDEEALNEQLDTLPSLCRFQLQQVSSFVVNLFEPSARHYSAALSQPASERQGNKAVRLRLAQSEGELAWLIYIIGQVLGSHLTPNSNAETQQLVDGELTALVLQLIPLLDAPETSNERANLPSNQHLHCALLFFLQQFRKVRGGHGRPSHPLPYPTPPCPLHPTALCSLTPLLPPIPAGVCG